MRVEEVKTSFVADTKKYIADIQRAQKVLKTFLQTDDLSKREKSENSLQRAIQKRATAEARALTEELKLKRQLAGENKKVEASQKGLNNSSKNGASTSRAFAGELAHVARNVMTLVYSVKALSSVLTTGIDFNRTKEDARLAFTVMFRSADVASQKIRELQEYAVKSPLSFKETISASKQLSAYGFAAEELIPSMKMLGTVAKATGHSLDDIAYIYGTLRTQGRAYSRDMMQFAQRGIPIYEELAEVMKVDQKQIKKMVEEGKVGFKEIEKAFANMTKEGGKFGGLLDEYMQGFSGIASQLEDTFQQSMGELTGPLFEELKKQMNGLINELSGGKLDKVLKNVGEALAEVVSYIGPLASTLVTLTPALIAFFKAWLAYVVISKAATIIASLPRLLRLVNVGIISMIRSMKAFSMSTWLGSIKAGFTSILAALSTFAKAAWGIIVANPLLAAILGVVALGTAIVVTVVHKQREEMEKERAKLSGSALMSYDLDPNKRGGVTLKGLKEDVGLVMADFEKFYDEFGVQQISLAISGIEKMAEFYKISAMEAADVAHAQGLLNDQAYYAYLLAQKNVSEVKRYKAAVAANKDLSIQNWLGGTTGKPGSAYQTGISAGTVTSKIPGMQTNVYTSAGTTAAIDYIIGLEQGLADKENHLKYVWEGMYKPEMMEENIKNAIDDIEKLLLEAANFTVDRNGKEIPWFDTTGWDEEMRRKLEELQKRLGDGKGKKAVEIKLDPWFDREKMAAATEMVFDDIALQRDKDLANARDKLKAQEISYEQYVRAINAIEEKFRADRVQAEKDAMDTVFDYWKNGSEDFFSELQRGFVKAVQSGQGAFGAGLKLLGGELIQGSEIGNVISSASKYKSDWIQQKKDEWIASGRNAGEFDPEFATALGRSEGTFDMAGAISGDIITQLIMAFAEMALSVKSVQKVLDPFGTMMEAAGKFLKPLLSVGFSGIASVLTEIGGVLGQILLPILMPLMMNLQFLAGLLKITIIPVLQIVGGAFAWLYDTVMVPFGNAVIDLINGVIDMINRIPWMDIEKLERFKTTVEMLAESSGELDATMQYMIGKLNRMIDEELQSLQDLYEVGAISGAELQSRTDELNLRRMSLEENMVDINVAQMESLDDIYNWLRDNGAFPDIEALIVAAQKGIDLNTTSATDAITGTGSSTATPTQWENAKNLANEWGNVVPILGHAAGAVLGGAADIGEAIWGGIAGWLGFADGTPYIPNDMVANVHKGEGIVPRTFMDSIRSGELTLSGNSSANTGSVNNYYITVEGTVMAENDLADTLADKIDQRRGRGYGRK